MAEHLLCLCDLLVLIDREDLQVVVQDVEVVIDSTKDLIGVDVA